MRLKTTTSLVLQSTSDIKEMNPVQYWFRNVCWVSWAHPQHSINKNGAGHMDLKHDLFSKLTIWPYTLHNSLRNVLRFKYIISTSKAQSFFNASLQNSPDLSPSPQTSAHAISLSPETLQKRLRHCELTQIESLQSLGRRFPHSTWRRRVVSSAALDPVVQSSAGGGGGSVNVDSYQEKTL